MAEDYWQTALDKIRAESGATMAEDYWQTALDKIRAERIRANKIALQKRLRAAAMKREREVSAIKSLMRPGH